MIAIYEADAKDAAGENADAKAKPEADSKKNEKVHTPDQEAVIDLAQEAKTRGLSQSEAENLVEMGRQVGFENSRGPETHPNRHVGKDPHIHIGPVRHIPVN